MSVRLKISRASLVVLLLVAGAFIFHSFSQKEEIASRASKEAPGWGEDIRIEGLRHFELNGEKLLWSINAEDARFYQSKNEVELDNVRITFYPSGGGEMTLIARKGYYETDTRNMSADDGVTGMSDQEYWFWTQHISYDAATSEITSTDKVILKKGRLSVEGIGMEGSVETRNVHILSSVKATYSATE